MPPQLSGHVLVTLLRQCFVTPSCQGSRMRREFLFGSSTRALHSLRSPRPRHRQSSHIPASSGYYSSNTVAGEITRTQSSINSTIPYPSEPHDYPSIVLASQENEGKDESSRQQEERYAIIGGGITGLSAAHYLSKELPNAKITVYEGSDRLGGWLNSRRVNVRNGDIVLEQGPRTLRPHTAAGMVTLEMVLRLHPIREPPANPLDRSSSLASKTNSSSPSVALFQHQAALYIILII
jgi:oxygen-dependent protoporphyrinogen oxidase